MKNKIAVKVRSLPMLYCAKPLCVQNKRETPTIHFFNNSHFRFMNYLQERTTETRVLSAPAHRYFDISCIPVVGVATSSHQVVKSTAQLNSRYYNGCFVNNGVELPFEKQMFTALCQLYYRWNGVSKKTSGIWPENYVWLFGEVRKRVWQWKSIHRN